MSDDFEVWYDHPDDAPPYPDGLTSSVVVAHTPPGSDDVHVGDREGCEECATHPAAPEPGTGTREALAEALHEAPLSWDFFPEPAAAIETLVAALAPEVARIEAEAREAERERIAALADETLECDLYDEPGRDCITAGPAILAADGCSPCRFRVRIARSRP